MAHSHQHQHSHSGNKKTLVISLIIITTYMIVEVIGGLLTNSLALLADAGHMLSDSISLLVALLAFILSEKAANRKKTYGYKRFEVLAAVVNGIALIGVALYIFYEAVDRFRNPPEIASQGMLVIAFIGLLVNLLVARIMMRGSDVRENINMRGAYLHVLSDMLGSVGAIIAALLIMFFHFGWADPLASIIVAILVLRSGYKVSQSSIHILMEGTPDNVSIEKITEEIQTTDGVESIHDLHIWTITSNLNALSCHVVVDENRTISEGEQLIRQIEHKLSHQNIQHSTIQLETSNHSHDDAILCKMKAKPSLVHHHH